MSILNNQWLKREYYWEHTADQGSQSWLDARKCRCTGTTNNGKSKFDSEDDIADYIAGVKEKTFTPESKRRMKLGSDNEYKARLYYEKKYNKQIKEVGLCVPKFNFNLGASVDGIIVGEDGIIEIKCPERLYYDLKKPNPEIKFYHYKQMQFNMAVLRKSFCDYIAYGLDGKVFVQRIKFDTKYWKELYSQTLSFWNQKVKPRLDNTKNSPIIPKESVVTEYTQYKEEPLYSIQVDQYNTIKNKLLNDDHYWNLFKSKSEWKYRKGIDFDLKTDLKRRYHKNTVLDIIEICSSL